MKLQAAPIAAPAAPAEDSYGSPQAAPVAASQAADDYGAPRGPPVGAGSGFREQKELPAPGRILDNFHLHGVKKLPSRYVCEISWYRQTHIFLLFIKKPVNKMSV